MDSKEQTPKPRRIGSRIWYELNRGTACFYRTLRDSVWGRAMTSYRREGASADSSSPKSALRYKPPSPARQRLADALSASIPIRGFRAVFGGLLDSPTACYGMFGLVYGIFSILFSRLGSETWVREPGSLIFSILVAVLSLPLLFSKNSFSVSLGHSAAVRRVFVGFLGIPQDRLTHIIPKRPPSGLLLALLGAGGLGILASVASLVISSWIIPLAVLVFVLLGMVFAYPETGVVLFTLMLPLLWLDNRNQVAVVVLILLTWCSYIVQLLLARRTIRFDKLDCIFLVMGLMILIMGFTGYGVTAESIWQSVSLAVCLSGYFLIVNLVNSRGLLRRCLVGVAISVVVVTVLAYIRRIPVENLMWLEGSRAGDAIIQGVNNAVHRLTQLWVDHSELYLVLVFSWLYAYLLHTKRLLRKFVGGVFVLLDLALILMTDSVSAMVCVAAVTILFLLMLGHKWLSVGILALPAVICGGCWIQYLFPVSEGLRTVLSRSRLYKEQLSESLWRMVKDHPAGIGVGTDAFRAVYPAYAAPDLGAVTESGNILFEILLSYGWAGLVIFLAATIFFLQKCFSALRCASVSKDRAILMGGVTSLLGMGIFGTVRSFMTSPRVFFTIMLVVAVCSTYGNILFEEHDVEEAMWERNDNNEDRILRQ